MELLEALGKIGLTRHESMLYLTLCKEGELTGYEAAKLSGITRSNAYLALAGLAEKGGANRIEGDAVRYAAVPAGELTANLRREYHQLLDYIVRNTPTREETTTSFLTITGEKPVHDKILNLIGQAKERIYLSLSRPEFELLLSDLSGAVVKGLKVVVITDLAVEIPGVVLYCQPAKPEGQIRLIVDSTEVLTGEFSRNGTANCIYSKNQNLVQLIKDSLTNEMKLIEMAKEERNPR